MWSRGRQHIWMCVCMILCVCYTDAEVIKGQGPSANPACLRRRQLQAVQGKRREHFRVYQFYQTCTLSFLDLGLVQVWIVVICM